MPRRLFLYVAFALILLPPTVALADFYKLLKKHGLHPGDAKEEKDTDSAESK
jgi:hypothetical protein